jgi:hypothetical protein
MECDHPTLPTQVVFSLSSNDFLDTEFPSDQTIMDVISYIVEPKDEMTQ